MMKSYLFCPTSGKDCFSAHSAVFVTKKSIMRGIKTKKQTKKATDDFYTVVLYIENKLRLKSMVVVRRR